MDVDDRLKKEQGADRRSRELDDRVVTENRELSDDERLEMFRSASHNGVLPDLPKIPGYHVCWLTTNNPSDSIHNRIRVMGYQPIRTEDIPGWEHTSLKTGEWAGCVGVNEMIACKLPERLYQGYMQEAHYDAPAREDGKLTDTADFLKNQADRDGGRLIEGEGLQELRRGKPLRGEFA